MELPLRAESRSPETPPGAPAGGEGLAIALGGATGWLNSPPLSESELRGRVVLVQFWTYTCINWLRTLAHVRAWHERYASHGLVVVGVHTPEFDVEREVENVRRAAADLRVDYPVALDGDYAVWEAFGNRFWPALYLLDAQGRIRHQSVGEGGEDRAERVLRQLLAEAGAEGLGTGPTVVEPRGLEAAADWADVGSGETYLGYERAENFASAGEARPDARQVYAVPEQLPLNDWGLSGDWTLRPQAAVLNRAGGRIAVRFHARDLHLVLESIERGASLRFRVGLDGRAPGEAHGIDVDARGAGTLTAPRLYGLVRQPRPIVDRTFEITFLDPGVRAYAVTFG
jgi:thiol-disulfide isomerase/thioredoxin